MNLLRNTITILAATLFLWGCSDNDEVENVSNDTISLSTNTIQVDKNGGSSTVTVTSSGDWRLTGICSWAHPSATSGKNGDAVTFTIDPNTENEVRTATFKFFTGSSVTPLRIEVGHDYRMELLSDKEMSISKDASDVRIVLNTNVTDPEITYSEGSQEWIAFDRTTEFGGKTTLIFKASENIGYKGRSAAITLSSPLVGEPITVHLAQEQTNAVLTDATQFRYEELKARSISFEVKYNVDYKVSVTLGSEWITEQTISEPEVGEDGLSRVIVTYQLSEAPETRKGKIQITGTEKAMTKDLVVIQKDPNAAIVNFPDYSFRTTSESNGWIVSLAGSECVVLEKGVNLTSLNISYVTDFTGIESFPNLTSIALKYSSTHKFDISPLHNVKEVTFTSVRYCSEFNLGDNPITNFTQDGASYAESLKIISSKIETLDLSSNSYNDDVVSIDVSECPALTTLDVARRKMKTLYLKTGQNIPNLNKNEVTEIIYK